MDARTAPPGRSRALSGILAGLCAGLLFAAATAGAGPEEASLELVGEGEYSWFGFRIYQASLSTDTGRFRDWTATERAHFEIRYYRNVSAAKLIEIAREEWQRLDVDAPQAWIERMREVLPDVEEGDTLSCLVLADERTVFYHNGEKTGEVRDPNFGPAFLSIWLHPDAKAADLRRALIGGGSRS